jgi:hypothetical protein
VVWDDAIALMSLAREADATVRHVRSVVTEQASREGNDCPTVEHKMCALLDCGGGR